MLKEWEDKGRATKKVYRRETRRKKTWDARMSRGENRSSCERTRPFKGCSANEECRKDGRS